MPDFKLIYGLAKEAAETSVGRAAVKAVTRFLEEMPPKSIRQEAAHALGQLENSQLFEHLPALKITDAPERKLIHVSRSNELGNLRDVDPGTGSKPNGLWFSPDHAWARSGIERYSAKSEGYSYLVDKSQANILKISGVGDLKSLHEKYQVPFDPEFDKRPIPLMGDHSQIDWRKVAQDYDGIQIDNFTTRNGSVPHWYRGLDMDSGAIWNASKVRVTPLGKISHSEMSAGDEGDDFARLLDDDFDIDKKAKFDENYSQLLDEQLK